VSVSVFVSASVCVSVSVSVSVCGHTHTHTHTQAITAMHGYADLPSPTNSGGCKAFRNKARRKHITIHHQWFDFHVDLDLMYEYVWQHRTWTNVEKVFFSSVAHVCTPYSVGQPFSLLQGSLALPAHFLNL